MRKLARRSSALASESPLTKSHLTVGGMLLFEHDKTQLAFAPDHRGLQAPGSTTTLQSRIRLREKRKGACGKPQAPIPVLLLMLLSGLDRKSTRLNSSH